MLPRKKRFTKTKKEMKIISILSHLCLSVFGSRTTFDVPSMQKADRPEMPMYVASTGDFMYTMLDKFPRV